MLVCPFSRSTGPLVCSAVDQECAGQSQALRKITVDVVEVGSGAKRTCAFFLDMAASIEGQAFLRQLPYPLLSLQLLHFLHLPHVFALHV